MKNNVTDGTIKAGGYLSFSYVVVSLIIHWNPDLKDIQAELLAVVNIGIVFVKKIVERYLEKQA